MVSAVASLQAFGDQHALITPVDLKKAAIF
jgi:hypothetical protein